MASIASMLTITRIHNSVSAAAAMRRHVGHCICCLSVEDAAHTRCVDRVVQLARDYAARRTAFGKLLKDHGLHMQTLARMEVTRCATI